MKKSAKRGLKVTETRIVYRGVALFRRTQRNGVTYRPTWVEGRWYSTASDAVASVRGGSAWSVDLDCGGVVRIVPGAGYNPPTCELQIEDRRVSLGYYREEIQDVIDALTKAAKVLPKFPK